MRIKYNAAFVIFFFLFVVNSYSQNNDELLSFAIHGNNFLASITLPDTWTVDMAYAKRARVNGFFYLKNYGLNNSPAAIIMNLAFKQNSESKFEEWIEYDLNGFLEYYEGFKSEELAWNIINKNGYKIKVFSLKNDKTSYLQYSAFFDVGLNYFANIYITIINKSNHDELVADFRKCLENSQFTGIGIDMQ